MMFLYTISTFVSLHKITNLFISAMGCVKERSQDMRCEFKNNNIDTYIIQRSDTFPVFFSIKFADKPFSKFGYK